MPAFARQEIVSSEEVSTYHLIARCVRRAFLCGDDPYSGKNYDHRKQKVQDRLKFLAGIFLIEIGNFAIMSNHFHLQVRIRPDKAKAIPDEEVLDRWWALFPGKIREASPEILPEELKKKWLADEEYLLEIRSRLSSISWFMKSLCEPIAKMANKEDDVTGKFWEGRFKSQKVLDEEGVLRVAAYIDLNPIRAKVAESISSSFFTSAIERLAYVNGLKSEIFLARFSTFSEVMDREGPFLKMSDREYIDVLNWYIKQDIDNSRLKKDATLIKKCSVAIGSTNNLRVYAEMKHKKYIKGIGSAYLCT